MTTLQYTTTSDNILTRGTDQSAGIDFKAPEDIDVKSDIVIIDSGIAVAIPDKHFMAITTNSRYIIKGLVVSLGIIDSDYRGNIKIVMINHGPEDIHIAKGEVICQGIIIPFKPVTIKKVSTLKPTRRGRRGFGSTGNGREELEKKRTRKPYVKKVKTSTPEESVATELGTFIENAKNYVNEKIDQAEDIVETVAEQAKMYVNEKIDQAEDIIETVAEQAKGIMGGPIVEYVGRICTFED